MAVPVIEYDMTVPETFFQANAQRLMKVFRMRNGNAIATELTKDPDLLAFLILSPSHMVRLQAVIQNEVLPVATSLANNANFETIVTLRAALDGFKLHFGHTDLEMAWKEMVNMLDVHFDEGLSEFSSNVRQSVHNVAAKLTGGKNRIRGCERSVLAMSTRAFNCAYGLSFSFSGLLCDIASFITREDVGRKWECFPWASDNISTKQFITQNTKIFLSMMLANAHSILMSVFAPVSLLSYCVIYVFSLFSFKSLLYIVLRLFIWRNGTSHLTRYSFAASCAVLVSLVMYLRGRKRVTLQAKEDKRVMSVMAFFILVTYIFDATLAEILSASLSGITRMSNLLLDDSRGFLRLPGNVTLQADSDDEDGDDVFEDIGLVDQVSSFMLNSVYDDVKPSFKQESQLSNTFAAWSAFRSSTVEDHTRHLSYPCKKVFALNTTNILSIVDEMIDVKDRWSQVVGFTGSGKSTRLPVAYYNRLKSEVGRRRQILVCEPTKAATVNVCGGISHWFKKQVYGKHEGWVNPGDMAIQVMTYGTAVFRQMADSSFLDRFDAVFLDESHLVSEHSLTLEAMCEQMPHLSCFYVSATPRDGTKCPEAVRRFPIHETHTPVTDPYVWLAKQGTGELMDVTKHSTILVFLAGTKQCDTFAVKWNAATKFKHKAYALHGQNFTQDYTKVLKALDNGNAIVFTTNILETGVTMEVDCVVEIGDVMRPSMNLVEKSLILKKERVTINERAQRVGRAGRLRDGYALICGDPAKTHTSVPPEVVYAAALHSFVNNLQLYVNQNFDTSWVGCVTKAQAQTMLELTLSPFITRDLVRPDGSIQAAYAPLLKKHAHRSADFKVDTTPIDPVLLQSWPSYSKLHAYMMRGEGEVPEKFKKSRVPFIIPHQKDLDWEKMAESYDSNDVRRFKTYKLVNSQRKMVVLQTNKYNIGTTQVFVKEMIERTQQLLHENAQYEDNYKSNMFMRALSSAAVSKKLAISRKHLEENYQTLVRHADRLEQISQGHIDMASDAEVEQNLLHVMELQADGTPTSSDIAKCLKLHDVYKSYSDYVGEYGNTLLLVTIIMLIITFLWAILSPILNIRWPKWGAVSDDAVRKRNQRRAVTLEGKGKMYSRDKRSVFGIHDLETFAKFDEEVESRRSKLKAKAKAVPESAIRGHKKKFMTLYDVTTDSQVAQALFYDDAGNQFHSTSTPLLDANKLTGILNEHLGEMDKFSRVNIDPNYCRCVITTIDGRQIEADMTTHEPFRQAALGVQGFEEKAGEFRQTGSTRIVGHVSLEASARIPATKVSLDAACMVGRVHVGQAKMNCILYNHWIIVPSHIMRYNGLVKFKFEHHEVSMSTDDVVQLGVFWFPGYDIMLIRKPNAINSVKLRLTAEKISGVRHVQMIFRGKDFKPHFTASDNASGTDFGKWQHSISTFNGMCGCAVFEPSTAKLLGIHTAANHVTGKNEFQPFTDDVMQALENVNAVKHRKMDWSWNQYDHGYEHCNVTELQADNGSIQSMNRAIEGFGYGLKGSLVATPLEEAQRKFDQFRDGGFKLVGAMSKSLITRHTVTGKCDYFESFLRDNPTFEWVREYTSMYEPSVLSFEAYYKDVKKYNRKPNVDLKYDASVLYHAKRAVIADLERAGMVPTRKMSTEEVLRDIEWNTSAGAAYFGKKAAVTEHMSDDQLRSFASDCYTKFFSGEAPGVWNGSLKAELRTKEKVQEKKTRVFTAAPLTSLIAMKYLVDDFNKQFYATHLKAPHTVGINKFGRGWERVFHKLNRPGWLHGSGDGSRFDSSIDPFLFECVKDVRKYFFNNQYQHEIDVLYDEIINTNICLANGIVVQKCVGNNSGQPSTVVDNTIVLMLSFYYAYMRKTNDLHRRNIEKYLVFVCNGDDNKFAISPEFNEEYGSDFSAEMEELGLTYVFDEITDDICENPYMSLTMVQTPFGVGFTLAEERIVAILEWTKKDGLLHAYQAAIAASVEAFNTPRLYVVCYCYLMWLVLSFQDELLTHMELKGCLTTFPTTQQIFNLHYYNSVELQADDGTDTGGAVDRAMERANRDDITSTGGSGSAWAPPVINMKKLYSKQRLPVVRMFDAPREVAIHDNTISSTNQLAKWEEAVKNDFGLEQDKDRWLDMLSTWCLWCAHNGTSDKTDADQTMEIPDGLGGSSDVPIRPFVERARQFGGLRRLMRHFSDDTAIILAKLGVGTKWGLSHGIVSSPARFMAFDFFVPNDKFPIDAIDQVKQARLAALGVGERNTMITSNTTNMLSTTTQRVSDFDVKSSRQ